MKRMSPGKIAIATTTFACATLLNSRFFQVISAAKIDGWANG